MRIDLHLHSKLSKKHGDSIVFYDWKHAISSLYKKDVSVASWTDHNNFNADEYIKARNISEKYNILLLPGVEADVIRVNGITGHVLCIFDNDLSDEELFELENQIITRLGKRKVDVKQLNDLFVKYKTIFIPHVGKGDFLIKEDLELLQHEAIEITNFDNSNYKKYMKEHEQTKPVVAFSDTHMWQSYPQLDRLCTITNEELKTFDELKNAITKNKLIIKEK